MICILTRAFKRFNYLIAIKQNFFYLFKMHRIGHFKNSFNTLVNMGVDKI